MREKKEGFLRFSRSLLTVRCFFDCSLVPPLLSPLLSPSDAPRFLHTQGHLSAKHKFKAISRRYFTLVELSAMGWYCRSRAQQRNEENSSFAFECVCVQEQRAPAVWTRQRHWVSRILSTGGSLATPSLIAAANEKTAALALLIDACAALRYVCGSGKPEWQWHLAWRMALLLAPMCTADMLARLIRGPVDKLSSCHCVALERNVDFTHRCHCRRRQSLARASVAPADA
jgi:hypothetical protein